ncbi:hypothetical protein Hanom_Chr16g01443011 [Helianthus anomalus]
MYIIYSIDYIKKNHSLVFHLSLSIFHPPLTLHHHQSPPTHLTPPHPPLTLHHHPPQQTRRRSGYPLCSTFKPPSIPNQVPLKPIDPYLSACYH